MVAADINIQVIEIANIIVDTTIRKRLNNYDSLHETNSDDETKALNSSVQSGLNANLNLN
ncbi:2756_t:CDS:2 [Funneliformis mosseae]|uniref:2756_t:CDS:1 n=1 Tax=Funneliformis mosseae TaxID=27381 RepID=A0A9N9AFS0_FUNMO|nr:2756_t:CDS:2 [Funneliformis mosseae]